MDKYYLIKENIVGNEKDLGNCLISIDKRVELTEEELKVICRTFDMFIPSNDYEKLQTKIRKVLE